MRARRRVQLRSRSDDRLSVIRGCPELWIPFPDCASLHPGYGLRTTMLSDGQDFRLAGSDPHHFANAFSEQLPRQR